MGYLILVGIAAVITAIAYSVGRTAKNSDNPSDKSFSIAIRIGSVILFVLFFSVFTVVRSFHSVPAGSVGVVYQFGNIVDQTEAGLVTTAPWQNLKKANVQVQRAEFTELDSFSEETQDVFIVATVNYRVDPKDIQDLYRNVGPDYFNKLVPNRVNQIFKDETVKYKAVNIAPNRETIRISVRDKLGEELGKFSIFVEDLLIDNIKFSPEFTKAIEGKQIATQDAQTAQNRVKEAQFKADQVIKAAQGEAQAYRLKQKTLTPLLVQQNAIDKLNPNVNVILLPSDSNFLLPGNIIDGGK